MLGGVRVISGQGACQARNAYDLVVADQLVRSDLAQPVLLDWVIRSAFVSRALPRHGWKALLTAHQAPASPGLRASAAGRVVPSPPARSP